MLKSRAEKFFKDVGFVRHVIEVEEDFDNVDFVMYERISADVLRRQMSPSTPDYLMSFCPFDKELSGKCSNPPMKGQYFKSFKSVYELAN